MAIEALDLRSMLRQFGVVTVMDVVAYKAERHATDNADKGIEEGEWDSVSTLKEENKLFSLKTLKIANSHNLKIYLLQVFLLDLNLNTEISIFTSLLHVTF